MKLNFKPIRTAHDFWDAHPGLSWFAMIMFVVICLFVLFGCKPSKPHVVEHDGCQYFHFGSGSSSSYTHSGTCTNPIHKCNPVVVRDTIYLPLK